VILLAQVLELLKFENLQGLRTTIVFGLILVGLHCALFLGFLSQENYVDLLKWCFGIYAGAKVAYKGTEVWQEKKNVEKPQ
jgi:hypothetical protein